MNFIGAFEVPAHIVTPMELEEQRRIQEERAAHEKELKERKQARFQKRNQEKREFTVRKKAGLLTPEESEAEEKRLAHNRVWHKEWRDKRAAALPPKPSNPISLNEIVRRKSAGLPLTPEELERYEAKNKRKTELARERRYRIKASEPPKVKKPTQKEVMERYNMGLSLTPEEWEIYDHYRARIRGYVGKQREKRNVAKTERADDLPVAANQ